METACAAHAATPSRVSRSVEANPHAPFASTRTPMPIDSLCASVPTWPFFVVRSRCRKCIARTSPYEAPRSFAVSSALVQKSHMEFAKDGQLTHKNLRAQSLAPLRRYHDSKNDLSSPGSYVPSCHEARYRSCSGVSLSKRCPID